MPHDDILAWIGTLESRVEHSELARRDRIDIGYGMDLLPLKLIVRIMLTDLEDLDDLSAQTHGRAADMTRYQDLLDDFRRLREQIG